MIRNNSDPAANMLKRTIGGMTSPEVSKYFPLTRKADVEKQIKLSKTADTLRKRITKADGTINKNHRDYKKYNQANTSAKKLSKQILYDFIRQNGGRVDVEEARKYMERREVEHSLPKGFVGMVGEDNTFYTKFGEVLDGVPSGTIRMNRTYKEGSTNWYFSGLPEQSKTGKPQRFYTKKTKARGKTKKFANVHNFIANLEKYKKAWRRYLTGPHNVKTYGYKGPREKQSAVVLEIMYWTAARIGTRINKTAGKGTTYGVSTMLNKHLKIHGNVVKVAYQGKGGTPVRMKFDIKDADSSEKKFVKAVIDFLKLSKKDGKPDDRVFDFNDANFIRYKFMRDKLGMSITPHAFRHVRGTIILGDLMPAVIKRLGENPDAKTVLNEFDKMTKKIGEELGHYSTSSGGTTGVTAVKNYLDPSVMLSFFSRYPYVKLPAALNALKKTMDVT